MNTRYLLALIISTLPLSACKANELANAPESSGSLQLELIARYASGQYGEGAAEVVEYHPSSKRLFVVNGASNSIDIITINNLPKESLARPYFKSNLSSEKFLLPTKVNTADGDIKLKSPNSISIHESLLAVAMQGESKQSYGAILFYEISEKPKLVKSVRVGYLPDMVTFSSDGKKVVVANEGEPSKDYKNDPEGSISIISVSNGIADKATHLDFSEFNSERSALKATGIKFASPKGTSVAQDLEPEYVAISNDSQTAYITLQENNGVAIVDLVNSKITAIKGLGFKDWNKYSIDVSNKDGAQLNRYENLYGIYQPDTIVAHESHGQTYLLTANEGDAREYIYDANESDCKAAGHKFDDEDGCISFTEEYRVKKLNFKSPSIIDSYYDKKGIGRLKVTNVLGDRDGDGYHEELYAYGGRSFSIWDEQGDLVWDSGDEFAKVLIERDPDNFNNNESKNSADNRSDDKGVEPEALSIGNINGVDYAFIGLERQGGIFIYDISSIKKPRFVNYIENRDYSVDFEIDDDTSPVTLKGDYDKVGDLGPESLKFISKDKSPINIPLLIVANEVSGSVSIYKIQ